MCPAVSFEKLSLEEGQQRDSLVVTVEAKLLDDTVYSFLSNSDINKFLKVKIIQSRNQAKTDQIIGNRGRYKNLGTLLKEGGIEVAEYSINDILASDAGGQYKILKGGGNPDTINGLYTTGGEFTLPDGSGYVGYYHIHPDNGPMVGSEHTDQPHDRLTIVKEGEKVVIPFTFQFNISEANPRNLSYFAFSYFDFESLGPDMDLPEDYRAISGVVESLEVIKAGQITGEGNSVIQDFRAVKRLSELDIKPKLADRNVPAKIERVNLQLNDGLKNLENSAYYTDFYVTRDRNGNSRFFFGIDMLKMMLQNSVFGKYFVDAPPVAIDQIMSRTRINYISVFRRRVVPLPGNNKLGGETIVEKVFDVNEPEKIIISANSNRRIIQNRTREGSLRELNILPGPEYKYLKHFVGSDLRMDEESYGHYQYGVEIEIEDGTIDFMLNKYNKLARAKANLDEYVNILNIPNVYQKPRRAFNLKQHYRDMVVPAIAIYLDIVSIFFRDIQTSENANLRRFRKRFTSALFDVTRPKTKTSKGVLELLQLIDNLLGKLRNTLGVASQSLSANISERSSAGSSAKKSGKSATSKKSYKFRKYFAELFDSETPKEVGFDYLTTDEEEVEDNEGLKTISFSSFGNRLGLEMDKFYADREANVTVDVAGQSLSLNTNIDLTPIHLGPSMVIIGKSKLPLTNQGVDLWDRESNDLVANRILTYKKTGHLSNSVFSVNNKSKLTIKQQQNSYYSNNFLSRVGVTIEKVVEEGIASKKTFVDDTFGDKLQKADTETESLDKLTTSQEVPQLGSINTVSKVMNSFSLGSKVDAVEAVNVSKEREEKLSLDRLNPTTIKNIFSQRLNNRSNTEIVSKMPLQLKSIVAASAGSAKVKNNWSQLSKDPFVDYRTSNSFIFNYLQLQAVEMLTGYQITEQVEGVLIKQPIFEMATLNKMRKFGSREILCRMKRFEDQDMPSVDTGEGLDLPLFDNYFIVQNEQVEQQVQELLEQRDRRRRRRQRRERRAEEELVIDATLLSTVPVEEQVLEDLNALLGGGAPPTVPDTSTLEAEDPDDVLTGTGRTDIPTPGGGGFGGGFGGSGS